MKGGQWKLMKVKKLDTITEAVATGINSVCESQIWNGQPQSASKQEYK